MTDQLTPFQEDLARRAIEVLEPRFPGAEFQTVVLPEDNAVYVYPQIRGGGILIVASDHSMLFAASSVQVEDALVAFRAGRRSDITPVRPEPEQS